MRFSSKALGAMAVATAGCVAGLGGGVAQADTVGASGLYAPSALVMTVGPGTDAATAGVQRAAVLNCAPKPSGSHPAAERACAEVAAVDGRFERLVAGQAQGACTRIWDPVVVTADGVWKGQRISWQHTFANPCTLARTGGSVFAF